MTKNLRKQILEALDKAGTSDGAKRGWETRRRGRTTQSDPQPQADQNDPLADIKAISVYNAMSEKEVANGIVQWANGDAGNILKALSHSLEDSNAPEKYYNHVQKLIEQTPPTKSVNLQSDLGNLAHTYGKAYFNQDATPEEFSTMGLGTLTSQHTFHNGEDNIQKGFVKPYVDALKKIGYPVDKLGDVAKLVGWNGV
jgi:hypothetical protein